mmetsp:Transcript_30/g.67  ORF Transcript_30/g.67 Transcript_30/m.67 type:complete len:466 (-) Transcript_30:190-1587(-)
MVLSTTKLKAIVSAIAIISFINAMIRSNADINVGTIEFEPVVDSLGRIRKVGRIGPQNKVCEPYGIVSIDHFLVREGHDIAITSSAKPHSVLVREGESTARTTLFAFLSAAMVTSTKDSASSRREGDGNTQRIEREIAFKFLTLLWITAKAHNEWPQTASAVSKVVAAIATAMSAPICFVLKGTYVNEGATAANIAFATFTILFILAGHFRAKIKTAKTATKTISTAVAASKTAITAEKSTTASTVAVSKIEIVVIEPSPSTTEEAIATAASEIAAATMATAASRAVAFFVSSILFRGSKQNEFSSTPGGEDQTHQSTTIADWMRYIQLKMHKNDISTFGSLQDAHEIPAQSKATKHFTKSLLLEGKSFGATKDQVKSLSLEGRSFHNINDHSKTLQLKGRSSDATKDQSSTILQNEGAVAHIRSATYSSALNCASCSATNLSASSRAEHPIVFLFTSEFVSLHL